MNRNRIVLLLGLVLLSVGIFAACGSPAGSTAEWHFDNGVNLVEEGQYAQAIIEFSKAIELDPNRSTAYYNRAYIYKLQGRKAEAIADFEKSITISDDPQLVEMARPYIEELAE